MGQCCSDEAAANTSNSSAAAANTKAAGKAAAAATELSSNSVVMSSASTSKANGAAATKAAATANGAATPTKKNGGKGASTKEDHFEVIETLQKVPLLQRLKEDDLKTIVKGLVEVNYKDDEAVFKQGDIGKEFFLIKEGEAVVLASTSAEQKSEEVAVLKRGDYFGESALITNNPRGATIRARGALVCLKLDGASFASLRKLGVKFGKRNAISAEAVRRSLHTTVDEAFSRDKDKVYDKSPETEQFIKQVMEDSLVFSNLVSTQKNDIMAEMFRMDVKSGTEIIKQGERGDNFYVVESGSFAVIIERRDGGEENVATVKSGGSFGELALLYGTKRAATVQAESDSVVWVVDRYMFRRMVVQQTEDRIKKYQQFIEGVDLFSSLLSGERTKIAEALEPVEFKDGETVVREGDKGDQFFIVTEGSAVVTKKHEWPEGEELPPDADKDAVDEVAVYKEGDFFGERSLIEREDRAATVTARGKLSCVTLEESAFRRLLGPLGDILKKRVEEIDRQNADRKSARGSRLSTSTARAAICQVRKQLTRVSSEYDHIEKLTDIEIIGTLGRGSFGHVQLVKDPVTGATFALKEVARSQVVELGQQEHILNEKRIMMQLESPFLIRLYRTFKSANHLYFLQEVALGGELFNILRNRVRFDEPTARFYTACVVLGFEHMHKQDIIFRDLKPENLLLDDQGFLKVTDFGFAKVCKDRAHTLCGTPDYLAPEMILGRGHSKGVDWWTLGILLYEMLVSYPPFYNEDDQMETYLNIVKAEITYPKDLSDPAVDLIDSLLERNPSRRLGVTKGGVAAIKRHKFFLGFDWAALEARRMTPPIIPVVKDTSDLSNFPPAPDEDGPAAPYQDDGSGWDDEF